MIEVTFVTDMRSVAGRMRQAIESIALSAQYDDIIVFDRKGNPAGGGPADLLSQICHNLDSCQYARSTELLTADYYADPNLAAWIVAALHHMGYTQYTVQICDDASEWCIEDGTWPTEFDVVDAIRLAIARKIPKFNPNYADVTTEWSSRGIETTIEFRENVYYDYQSVKTALGPVHDANIMFFSTTHGQITKISIKAN